MEITEHLKNARECAHDALVLLDAAEKLQDKGQALGLVRKAAGWLHVGADEAARAAELSE